MRLATWFSLQHLETNRAFGNARDKLLMSDTVCDLDRDGVKKSRACLPFCAPYHGVARRGFWFVRAIVSALSLSKL
jgi:hypothetical protein